MIKDIGVFGLLLKNCIGKWTKRNYFDVVGTGVFNGGMD
jgi:hypothetical protein